MQAGAILFSTDNGIGNEASVKHILPHGVVGAWSEWPLLGSGGSLPANWTLFWLWLLPLNFYMNWMHYIDLVVASAFLILFLVRRGLRTPSIALGVLAAFWVGTDFCLVYGGHTGKFAVLAFMAMALFALDKAVSTQQRSWALLAGGAMGIALLEQPDVAMFIGMFWACYTVFAIVQKYQWHWRLMLKLLLPVAAVVLLVGLPGSLGLYSSQTKGVTFGAGESPQAKWEFTTQWSQPPEETFGFAAPGFFGWRSSEPEGPYWGRLGRSAGWEQSGQGLMNFKLDDAYLGIIPIVFALLAVFIAMRKLAYEPGGLAEAGLAGPEEARQRRMAILFWAVTALLALLLAMGKFFPLYALFYQLPIVNNIRVPVKFLHVFQIALAILAAYGFDALLSTRLPRRT